MTTASEGTTFEDIVGVPNPFDADQVSGWIVVFGFVLVGVYYYFYFMSSRRRSSLCKTPPCIPGSMVEILSQFFSHNGPKYLLGLSRKVNKVFELPIAPPGSASKFVVVCEATLARTILENPKTLKWHTGYSFFDMVVGGDNLFSAEGMRYKHARKSTSSAFANPLLPRMYDIVQRLVNEWTDTVLLQEQDDDGVVVDISKEMQRVTIRIICEVAFEHRLCDNDRDMALDSLQTAYQEFAVRTPQNPLRQVVGFIFPKVREARRAGQALQTLCRGILDDYRAIQNEMTKDSEEKKKRTVLCMINEDPDYKNDGERVRDMVTYLAGGYDTASYTISWTLLTLAKHPTKQKWLREELLSVTPEQRRPYDCSALKWVIREIMRLFVAPAMGSIRTTSSDIVTPTTATAGQQRYLIPKGSIVLTCFFAIHRDGDIFEDPDEFIPERWENPTPDMTKAWLAFGAGRRNCPGQVLASVELRVMLAKLCSEYEWTVVDEGRTEFYVTLKTVDTVLRAKKVASP